MATGYKTKRVETIPKDSHKAKNVATGLASIASGAGTLEWTNRLREVTNHLTFSSISDKVYHRTSTQIDIFPIPRASRDEYGTFETTELHGIEKAIAYLGKWMNESEINIAGYDVSVVQGLTVLIGAALPYLAVLAKNKLTKTIGKAMLKYKQRKEEVAINEEYGELEELL